MLFNVNETFEIITSESAEHGEVAESGFNFENATYTFRELVEYLDHNGYCLPSCYPLTGREDFPVWISTESQMDMYSGDYENTSLHLLNNDARAIRYWNKAIRMVLHPNCYK